mgnify:CR=1 FL=1|tara:strand:+ start:317 stop:508 length:192 start_codon:yes stop_codon:yes gene_type:complete
MNTYTIEQIETDPAIKNLNLTRRQLIDHLLDEMNEKGDKETMQYLIDRQDAVEKLKALCPKRK